MYSVQIQENTDQENSVFGHFSRSEVHDFKTFFGFNNYGSNLELSDKK